MPLMALLMAMHFQPDLVVVVDSSAPVKAGKDNLTFSLTPISALTSTAGKTANIGIGLDADRGPCQVPYVEVGKNPPLVLIAAGRLVAQGLGVEKLPAPDGRAADLAGAGQTCPGR